VTNAKTINGDWNPFSRVDGQTIPIKKIDCDAE